MLWNRPSLNQPEWAERKKQLVWILKRKFLNQITRNIKWVSLNDIEKNITDLYNLDPKDIIEALNQLIEDDFGRIKSVKKRNKIITDLIEVFDGAYQKIESDEYKTNTELSLDQEVNRLNRKLMESII